MNNNMVQLEDRSILEITGADRKKFLQGLITNDINKATNGNLIYSAMLNAQGRFLYDFFIFEIDEKLMLDCFAPRRDEILKKLNFYKLRAQVEIKKNDELKIFQSFEDATSSFSDPRSPNLGHRIYSTDLRLRTCPPSRCDESETADSRAPHRSVLDIREKRSAANLLFTAIAGRDGGQVLTPCALRLGYDLTRISLKIPESELDLTYEKSFILEFGFDDLNAIDYQKGCYVGQEITARTHYRGEIRKKIFHVRIIGETMVEKNSEITCEGKSVGIILSSVFYQNDLHALALIKTPANNNFSELTLKNHKIFIVE
jgi:folate-binding protein YgfZ